MPRHIRSDDPKNLNDERLVERIAEFRSAEAACRRELTKLVGEFQARRVQRVRAGEPAEKSGEEGVLIGSELNDSIRREQVCAAPIEGELVRSPRAARPVVPRRYPLAERKSLRAPAVTFAVPGRGLTSCDRAAGSVTTFLDDPKAAVAS